MTLPQLGQRIPTPLIKTHVHLVSHYAEFTSEIFPTPISRALPIFFPLRPFPTKTSLHSYHLDSIHPFYTIPTWPLYRLFPSGHYINNLAGPFIPRTTSASVLTTWNSILFYVTTARDTSSNYSRGPPHNSHHRT